MGLTSLVSTSTTTWSGEGTRWSPISAGWRCSRRTAPARVVDERDRLPAIALSQPRRHALRRHRRDPVTVAENLAELRERGTRAGRDPDEVAIVAVTKGFDVSVCRQALDAGLRMLGENRVQEALAKMEQLPDVEWHLIGHLQTNKA